MHRGNKPHKHDVSLLKSDEGTWLNLTRAIRMGWELFCGFNKMRKIGPCVTVFGSARFDKQHDYYKLANAVGCELGRSGFSVMTGGGPGIMEAANRGAQEVGAHSVGCNIKLPVEQIPNKYLDTRAEFHYFFVRKIMLIKYSSSFIIMPGGFGTMDEVFEILTLIQSAKISRFPLVVMGSKYWSELLKFLETSMLAEHTIDIKDIQSLYVTDSPSAAVKYILKSLNQGSG